MTKIVASVHDTYIPFVEDVYLIENPATCIKLGKKKEKRKENYLVIIDAIRQGLQKIFPQVNKNLVNLFESLPHVLANSRERNTNKSHMNSFIKWQKWANQFPEVNATPAEEIYVILHMLSLFQNNKSYSVIQMSHYVLNIVILNILMNILLDVDN